ncbi:response regulator [Flavitalea sp. BT771]|uniref:response regulator n=1 Tax=Flavitalea sp. BT771 TaxID=3063329 RepID=UPI0026E2989F|nr:response regulator [Flavitalea sp. BT771]MDO6429753.1 response regulator [Flavitalea sp. BT771]MDV6218119.1 response regulator [Flavitalea sp. BT771]
MIIMLVDDDEDDRKLFLEATKEVDDTISCITTGNAPEALLYLRNTDNPLPDYIFLDLRMPGLSGKDCLVELKKDARLMPIPVIVYTTSRDVKESIELKRLGATHFMTKPVFPDDVYYMVSFVLGEKWE